MGSEKSQGSAVNLSVLHAVELSSFVRESPCIADNCQYPLPKQVTDCFYRRNEPGDAPTTRLKALLKDGSDS
jgi:hypothetical protein